MLCMGRSEDRLWESSTLQAPGIRLRDKGVHRSQLIIVKHKLRMNYFKNSKQWCQNIKLQVWDSLKKEYILL